MRMFISILVPPETMPPIRIGEKRTMNEENRYEMGEKKLFLWAELEPQPKIESPADPISPKSLGTGPRATINAKIKNPIKSVNCLVLVPSTTLISWENS